MRISRIIILLLFLPVFSFAQEKRVTGVVVDDSNGEPLPFATLAIPSQNRGTITNSQGYFELTSGAASKEDFIVVSVIGYEQKKIPLETFLADPKHEIRLKPQSITLNEVVIEDKNELALNAIKQAAKKRGEHLHKTPLLVDCLYREALEENQQPAGITDGVGILYIAGFQPSNGKDEQRNYTHDVTQWKDMRRSDYRVGNDLQPETPRLLSAARLLRAKERYTYSGPVSKAGLKQFDYFMDSIAYSQEVPYYYIRFQGKENPELKGKVLIKGDDYGVLSLEVHGPGGEPRSRKAKSARSSGPVSHDFRVFYSFLQGKYYLAFLFLEQEYQIQSLENGEASQKIKESMELLCGNFRDQKADHLSHDQLMVLNREMANPIINYRPMMWEEMPPGYATVSSETRKGLEGKSRLEEQFRNHHGKRIIELPKGFNNYEELYRDQQLFNQFLNLD